MRIPKSLKLNGQTITVEFDSAMAHTTDNTGEAHYRFNKIKVQGVDGYVGRPQSKVEQAFCHELVHFILYFGECHDTKELYRNEMVVERLAHLLHQALSTMEYEENQ